jgi:predicted N-acetyltransferase YhbS
MGYRIRSVGLSELPQVHDLLGRAFPEAPRDMFVRQTQDGTFRVRHGRVAADSDGRIFGWVRIFQREMWIGTQHLPVGGIGQVATDRFARRQGIATALLRDAIDIMQKEGMVVSFLFTGIPGFYERLGYRIVPQVYMDCSAAEAVASTGGERWWLGKLYPGIDRRRCGDISRLAKPVEAAGLVSPISVGRGWTWRWPAADWLGEDPLGCRVARPYQHGVTDAFIRCADRPDGYKILAADAEPGCEDALVPLLRVAAARAITSHGRDARIGGIVPEESALAALLRTMHSVTETREIPHPMMIRALGDHSEIVEAFMQHPVYFWNADRI